VGPIAARSRRRSDHSPRPVTNMRTCMQQSMCHGHRYRCRCFHSLNCEHFIALSLLCCMCRSIREKTNDAAHDDVYSILYSILQNTNTHMICNGDIFTYDDIEFIRRSVLGGASSPDRAGGLSFMMARAAMWDPSVFRSFKVLPHNMYHLLMLFSE
jgi:hypothetical protein